MPRRRRSPWPDEGMYDQPAGTFIPVMELWERNHPDLDDGEEDAEETYQPPRRKSRRGGRRPGAGAPVGNLNALKSGNRSQRFLKGAILLASVPELKQLMIALRVAATRRSRQRTERIFAAAIAAAEADPDVAADVRRVVLARLRDHGAPLPRALANFLEAPVVEPRRGRPRAPKQSTNKRPAQNRKGRPQRALTKKRSVNQTPS